MGRALADTLLEYFHKHNRICEKTTEVDVKCLVTPSISTKKNERQENSRQLIVWREVIGQAHKTFDSLG